MIGACLPARQRQHVRVLVAAGPHHEAQTLSTHTLPSRSSRRIGLGRVVQARQRERRRRLVDQRRRHLARVELEARPQKAHQHQEHRQRNDETQTLHDAVVIAAVPCAPCSRAAWRGSGGRWRRAAPPSAISTQPPQIQSTNGLKYTRTIQRVAAHRLAERDVEVAREAGDRWRPRSSGSAARGRCASRGASSPPACRRA